VRLKLSDDQRQRLLDLVRVLVTLTMVAVAAWALHWVWSQQQARPWTRDGQVLANVIHIAPQVAGPVAAVHVADNQRVEQGQLLLEIDPALFAQTVRQTKAALTQAEAEASDAAADARRATALHKRGDLSDQDYDLKVAQAAVKAAAVEATKVALDTAKLKLGYTKVRAPTSGYVTNLELGVGTYAEAGSPLIALVDEGSFWIDGYFKETDLSAIRIGDPAMVTLMGHPHLPLRGRVESIAFGIARRNIGPRLGDLAAVEPTFEWIRLAQRMPVRIKLDQHPAPVPLRIGYTASVAVNPSGADEPRPTH
jgi:multidrug resistance efflux pump